MKVGRIRHHLKAATGDPAVCLAEALEYERKDLSISAFYSVVLEEARRVSDAERGQNFRSRGVAHVDTIVQSFLPQAENAVLKSAIQMSKAYPNVQAEFEQILKQCKVFTTGLASSMWDAACLMIEADFEACVRWIEYRGPDYSTARAWNYATKNYLQSAVATRSKWPGRTTRGETSDYWRPIVAGCGGGRHLFIVALASVMTADVLSAFTKFRGCDHDYRHAFKNPEFKKFLLQPLALWLPRYQFQAITLGCLPEEFLDQFLADLETRQAFVIASFKDALEAASIADADIRITEKESATLRKRISTSETSVAQLRNKLQRLSEELTAAKQQRPVAGTDSDAQRENVDLRTALRERDLLLLKSQAQTEHLMEEAARLREFLNLVLEPSPDAVSPTAPLSEVASDPASWRLVFVGGHERLHHKLRRVLRNAVFLHPDQSLVRDEVFESADAVIFSIGYCNHKLSWRAADAVRKRGLRAGYAGHSNVDLILEEIRGILFDGHADSMPKPKAA